jgi:hypothetical protein
VAAQVPARVAAASVCALALFARTLSSQIPTGAIEGTIIDREGKPIRDVEVSVAATPTSVRSDSLGKFLLASVQPGERELHVRRLAFAPATVKVEVESEDTVSVTITLSVIAQTLNAVLVRGDVARARLMQDFEDRRKRGFGHFITRSDIEERHPLLLSELVRRIPGAMLAPTAAGRSTLRFSRAMMGRDCPPQYWIDGVMVTGFNIDDMMPGDVEGIELYAGPSVVPPQFNNPRSSVNCGLVLIWTRVPGS